MTKTPGRPKKSQQDKAPKNGTRDRQYSIVIHDIKKGLKNTIDKRLDELKPDWRLVAEEEYNHQDGQHIHIFLKYKEKKAFSAVLKWFKEFSAEHGAGRVQVDAGRGSFQQCEKYLVNPDKDKKVDDNVIRNVRRKTRKEINEGLVARYPDEVGECQMCNVKVWMGMPVLYKTPGGEIAQLIFSVHCPECQKKISGHSIRQDATQKAFTKEASSFS